MPSGCSLEPDISLKNQWGEEHPVNVQLSRLGTFSLDSVTEEDARVKSIKTDASEAHHKYAKTSRKKSTGKVCPYMDGMCFVGFKKKNSHRKGDSKSLFEHNFKQQH